LLEKCGGFLQAIGLNASGRQLDREWHAVEFAANTRHGRRIRIIKVQARAARFRALQK
jgi:hypothetical protein